MNAPLRIRENMWWACTKCSAKIFTATECWTLLHTLSIQAIFHNDIIKFEISFISTEAVWKRWIIILWKLKCCFSNDKFCSKLQKPSKTKSHSQNCHWFCFEMYLTLEFGKFQTKKGLKQENLRKIELEFVSISWVINHMTCYNSSALIGWKFILKKSICKICSPTWLLDSTNESTRIYNRSCVWITSLYLQIPTENHSKRLKSSYLKLKIHYHIWKRESILISFKTKIHLGLEFLHLLHCLH